MIILVWVLAWFACSVMTAVSLLGTNGWRPEQDIEFEPMEWAAILMGPICVAIIVAVFVVQNTGAAVAACGSRVYVLLHPNLRDSSPGRDD